MRDPSRSGAQRRPAHGLPDRMVAGLALGLLSPLLVAVGLVVRIGLGTPVLFRQVRPGLDARPFTLYKFRTMRRIVDDRGRSAPDSERLTRLGRVLRTISVDHLPELWNVLAGDMVLVGPRPLLMKYLPLYTREQFRRHEIRPGITGMVQVCGRNGLSWEQKFDLDIWYIEHRSLRLDLHILWRTLPHVVRCDGIHQPGHATARCFEGSTQPACPPAETES